MNYFEKEKHHFSNEESWDSLKKRTNEITNKSLQSLKNKMGNRYKNLPFRHFAEKKIARFLSSHQVATAFIAPDSYGKTPIIVQLVEKFSTGSNALYPNDILCLVDGTILYNLVTNHKKINRLYNLIEYNPQNSFSTIFRDRPELVKGKFILIIDEVDDIYSSDVKTSQFIDNLLKLIISYENINWFKVLITCTPRTWRIFQEKIQKNQLMQRLWYNVPLQGSEQDFINIPLLKNKEIDEVFREKKLPDNVNDLKLHNPDLLNILRNPYLLHLFILSGKTNKDLRDIDLLNLYIKKMVFTPPLLNEKYSVLNSYFDLCSKSQKCMEVKKEDLKLSSSDKLAYIELIRIGFFYEYSLVDEYFSLTTYVSFSHHSLYAYYMANILLKDKNLRIEELRDKIKVYEKSSKLQRSLVEYILKILLKEERIELLKDIFTLIEKKKIPEAPSIHYKLYWWSTLTSILSDEMRKKPLIRKVLLPVYAQSEIGQTIFFERFFDFDCLGLTSGDELELLAQDIQTPQCVYFIHFMNFMQYFLSDDRNQCHKEYNNIKKLPVPKEESPLNTSYYFIPQIIYQSVYNKKLDERLLAMVYQTANKFIKNGIQNQTEIPTFEFGILFALNYGKMSNEIIDLSNYIFDNYELANLQLLISYQLFLSVYARALLESGDEKRALEFYKQVKFKHLYFPKHMRYYIKIRLMLIKAEFLIHQKEHKRARKILDKIKSISLKLKFKYFYDEAFELRTELEQEQLI
ncbi:hypothetical protein [Sunxiuqinia sp. sy24]|uniref:hypothetical protein n=1 Tax=Sunxiuqinia sp. sy24 TaxID=3461495 RepID=UPI004045BB02